LSIKVSPVEKVDNPIKVLTYNVLQYGVEIPNTSNQDLVLDMLNETGADIIGLQEAFGNSINGTIIGTSWLATQLGMYHFKTATLADNIHGITLLSRWPIIEQNYTMLRKATNRFSRVVIHTKIDSPYGEINIFNTHVDTPRRNADRIKQINDIIDLSKGVPLAIIMGDFNTIDSIIEVPYRRLSTTFSDAWIASGKLAIEGRTYPASFPILRLDYIWLSGTNWNVVKDNSKLVGNSSISDHLGVYVEVEIANSSTEIINMYCKLSTNSLTIDTFRKVSRKILKKFWYLSITTTVPRS
jgi:endonuclease/exonuclease/phosphatase family metal-dependent hydrolase